MYPHVLTLKEMFEDFFPEFQANVIRNDDSWRMVNTGHMFWADEALQLKRQGDYVKSCGLYFYNILQRGEITLGWAQGIFKTLACAGDIGDALAFGREWMNFADTSLSEPDSLLQHFSTLLTFVRQPEYDQTMLPQYLQSISGNPGYSVDLRQTDLYKDPVLRKLRGLDDAPATTGRSEAPQGPALDGTFHTKVVGVTFKNDDGSDRQRIIRNLIREGALEEGTELFFVPQPTNPHDSNCVLVQTGNGQTLGTLSRDVAAQVSPQIRQGYTFKVYVASQTGGDIGYAYGINIKVERYR